MTTNIISETTIAYGPTHHIEMRVLIGAMDVRREIDQCAHTGGGTMQAYRTFLNISTGKVFKVIDNGISYSKVLAFDSIDAYRAYDKARQTLERDPETGRLFSEYK